jgi:hypothetical protein
MWWAVAFNPTFTVTTYSLNPVMRVLCVEDIGRAMPFWPVPGWLSAMQSLPYALPYLMLAVRCMPLMCLGKA